MNDISFHFVFINCHLPVLDGFDQYFLATVHFLLTSPLINLSKSDTFSSEKNWECWESKLELLGLKASMLTIMLCWPLNQWNFFVPCKGSFAKAGLDWTRSTSVRKFVNAKEVLQIVNLHCFGIALICITVGPSGQIKLPIFESVLREVLFQKLDIIHLISEFRRNRIAWLVTWLTPNE